MSLPDLILAEKVIPVARRLTAAGALPLADALAAGNVNSLEVTMESGAAAIEAIRALADRGTEVGAGTVMTVEEARSAIDAGASFLVSPHFDPYLVEFALEAGVPHLPGILTPTEAASAMSMGVTTVKLFPAGPGGPDLIRALHGPFPELRIVPTGGVTVANAAEFIAAGAIAVGVGSWLTGGEDHGEITTRARQLRSAVS